MPGFFAYRLGWLALKATTTTGGSRTQKSLQI
jgi:hypothetical protein